MSRGAAVIGLQVCWLSCSFQKTTITTIVTIQDTTTKREKWCTSCWGKCSSSRIRKGWHSCSWYFWLCTTGNPFWRYCTMCRDCRIPSLLFRWRMWSGGRGESSFLQLFRCTKFTCTIFPNSMLMAYSTGTGNGTSTIGDNGSGSCSCLSAVWTVNIICRNPLILVPFPVPLLVPVPCSVNTP